MYFQNPFAEMKKIVDKPSDFCKIENSFIINQHVEEG